MLKLDILTELANSSNLSEILNELGEYVTDEDEKISRLTITAVGKIAIKNASGVDEALEHLLSFFEFKRDYVTSESCIVIRDILRKYPERYEEVLPGLTS